MPYSALMLVNLLQTFVGTVIVGVAGYGYGRWLPRIFPETYSRTTQVTYAFVGGFGILGAVLFAVGQWSLSRATIGIVLAAGCAQAVPLLLRARPRALWLAARVDQRSAIPAAIVAAVLVITAIGGLAQPVGDTGNDGIAYHFAGPKVWLRHDIVRPLPDNAPTAYPATVEMVFAALLEVGGARAPAFSAVLTLSLFLATCATVGRRFGLDMTGAWWVAALVAAMPAVYGGAYAGFVDTVYASFLLVAVRLACDATRRRHFVAMGVFLGLLVATKYTGLTAVPLLLFLCAVLPAHRRPSREVVWHLGAAAAVATVVGAPVYIRNWLLLGSPIYPPPPGVATLLQLQYMSVQAVSDYYASNAARAAGFGTSLWSLICLPYNLTLHTGNFNGAGGIGLAPLALGPLGLIAAWPDRSARRLALLATLLLLTWFVTMQESRFLISVYAIGAVFAVHGWEFAAVLIRPRGRLLCGAVIAVSVVLGLAAIGDGRADDVRSALSPAYARARQGREVPYVESVGYLNRDSSVVKVLVLDPRVPGYYFDRDYLKAFGQYGEQAVPGASTPADVLARLAALGISHVLDVQSAVSDFRVPRDFPGLEMVFEQPRQRVYRVVVHAE